MWIFGVLLLFVSTVRGADDLAIAFAESSVTPDVLSVAPAAVLNVKYPTGVEANLGNELTPSDVRLPPLVSWQAEPGVYYTLVLVDPDAPSRKNPEAREFLHWLVGNIQGNDLANAQTIAEYLPSAPPKDSGLHRYVVLLFRQPTRINYSSEPIRRATSTRNRAKFSVQNFARQYNLDVPINGNFYVSKYDSIVPNIHKSLVD